MEKRKTISFVLALALLVAALTGCQSQDVPENSSADNSTSAVSGSVADSESSLASGDKDITLESSESVSSAADQPQAEDGRNALVLLTDFGLKDGAVSEMKGVCYGIDRDLDIFDITHDIPSYDIWAGAYRFRQSCSYWPVGTVFVGVVDPGVGTDRKSIVLQTKKGQYFVGPDNGLFSLIAEADGIKEVRVIDESKNRLKGSEKSYTFHGRDVYGYVGAMLASGKLKYEEVGPVLDKDIITFDYQKAEIDGDSIKGNIPILDVEYGNVWSNISDELFEKWAGDYKGDYKVRITNKDKVVYEGTMPFADSFGFVEEGKPLIYYNSLLNVSVALNMKSFAEEYGVSYGQDWTIEISKVK